LTASIRMSWGFRSNSSAIRLSSRTTGLLK
jgi:hypothetical protein